MGRLSTTECTYLPTYLGHPWCTPVTAGEATISFALNVGTLPFFPVLARDIHTR